MEREHAIYVMDHPSKQRLQTKQIINQIKQFKIQSVVKQNNHPTKKNHTHNKLY